MACVSVVKEGQVDGLVHGWRPDVVSLAKHSNSYLLSDPHDHITWTLLSPLHDTQQPSRVVCVCYNY